MLYRAVTEYLQKDIYPFHMPGHKRNASIMPQDILSLDMTEIPGLDNLHNANGVICSEQESIACLYGADTCFFSVNGSSAGIIAAICAACGEGGAVLTARNSHISAFSGLVFSGARPVYIYPEMAEYGLCGGISPLIVKQMLESNPECQAVFITSPTYEGFVSDIKTIAEYTHQYGKLLIVDEAHGAHFPFHSIFPEPAIRLGADIVINSPHKTLPALTQSALVLVKGSNADTERLRFFMRACQTSSPSYIIMSTADYTFQSLLYNNDLFEAYIERLNNARKALTGLSAFRLIGNEVAGTASVYAVDLSKMLFVSLSDITGVALEQKLADDFKVQLEMSSEHFALALTSAADTGEGFERLIKGITTVDKLAVREPAGKPHYNIWYDSIADSLITPRQAVFSPSEQTTLYNCVGKTAADFICVYPPGIPILAPGERITDEIARKLSLMKFTHIKTIKSF